MFNGVLFAFKYAFDLILHTELPIKLGKTSQLWTAISNIRLFLICQVLLHHKVTNVNIEGRNKYTPLHNAAYLENRNALEICQKLVRITQRVKIYRGAEGYSRGEGGIRDLTKIQCRIRATLPRYGIRLLPWKRDSPKFGKENDIRDSNDGSSGRGILVEQRRESGITIFPFQILIYHWNEVVPFFKAKYKQAKAPMRS